MLDDIHEKLLLRFPNYTINVEYNDDGVIVLETWDWMNQATKKKIVEYLSTKILKEYPDIHSYLLVNK